VATAWTLPAALLVLAGVTVCAGTIGWTTLGARAKDADTA